MEDDNIDVEDLNNPERWANYSEIDDESKTSEEIDKAFRKK
jgi:hypothetical protein